MQTSNKDSQGKIEILHLETTHMFSTYHALYTLQGAIIVPCFDCSSINGVSYLLCIMTFMIMVIITTCPHDYKFHNCLRNFFHGLRSLIFYRVNVCLERETREAICKAGSLLMYVQISWYTTLFIIYYIFCLQQLQAM